MTLSNAQVKRFFDDGFVVLRELFAPEEVATVRAAFRRLHDTARCLSGSCMHRGSQFVLRDGGEPRRGVAIERVSWCGAAEPILARFGLDRRLLEPVVQLLGTRRMNQLINQAHFKLPGDGVGFPWHQDSTHRRYGSEWTDVNGRGSYVQTVLAVDDVTADNGPLRLIPGSGRLGHLGLPRGGALPAKIVDEDAAVAPQMKAGSVLLFGPYTIHSSEPNTSPLPRRALLNGYACPGANARVYPGDGAGRLIELPAGGGPGVVLPARPRRDGRVAS